MCLITSCPGQLHEELPGPVSSLGPSQDSRHPSLRVPPHYAIFVTDLLVSQLYKHLEWGKGAETCALSFYVPEVSTVPDTYLINGGKSNEYTNLLILTFKTFYSLVEVNVFIYKLIMLSLHLLELSQKAHFSPHVQGLGFPLLAIRILGRHLLA